MVTVLQWLTDITQKVMLENGEPVPVLLLANKVKSCSVSPLFGWYVITLHFCKP